MLRSRPFAFTDDRESSAIDDEVDGLVGRGTPELDIEMLATPRERGVVRGFEIDTHQVQERP